MNLIESMISWSILGSFKVLPRWIGSMIKILLKILFSKKSTHALYPLCILMRLNTFLDDSFPHPPRVRALRMTSGFFHSLHTLYLKFVNYMKHSLKRSWIWYHYSSVVLKTNPLISKRQIPLATSFPYVKLCYASLPVPLPLCIDHIIWPYLS